MLEGQGIGATWANLGTPITIDDTFSLQDVFNMLLADTLIYFLLACGGTIRLFLCSRSGHVGQLHRLHVRVGEIQDMPQRLLQNSLQSRKIYVRSIHTHGEEESC